MSPRPRRVLRAIGLTVLGVVVLYFGGVNLLLATPGALALINQRPDIVEVHYSKAWTVWPLRFELRDFSLSIRDRLVHVTIVADSARGDLRPWALSELRFVANNLVADGVSFRVEKNDPPSPKLPLLTLDFQRLHVTHLREVWIDRVHYTGDAEVSGGLLYAPFQRLRFDDVRFDDAHSTLVAVEPHTATFERLSARLNLAEVSTAPFTLATLASLEGHLVVLGTTEPGFLNAYLGNIAGVPHLGLLGDEGTLDLLIDVERGQVRDGSRLSYRSKKAGVHLPWLDAVGDLSVEATTSKHRVAMNVTVKDPVLERGAFTARAQAVTLDAASDADLTRTPAIDATLSLSRANVTDLRAIDALLPPGPALRLAKGHGRLDAKAWLLADPPRAHGEIVLTADDVVVKNRAATIAGRLKLTVRLRSYDFERNVLDLSGSTLDIDDATVSAGAASWQRQWLHVRLQPCRIAPDGPLLWATGLELGAANLQPLFALIAANVEVSKIIGALTDSPNVHFGTDLELRAAEVKFANLKLTTQSVRLEGALTLKPSLDVPPRFEPWGGVVLHVTPFDLGVQFAGRRVSVVSPSVVTQRK